MQWLCRWLGIVALVFELVGNGRAAAQEPPPEPAAAEPPARAMLPALSFFVAIIALGLAVGRWSKRRTLKS